MALTRIMAGFSRWQNTLFRSPNLQKKQLPMHLTIPPLNFTGPTPRDLTVAAGNLDGPVSPSEVERWLHRRFGIAGYQIIPELYPTLPQSPQVNDLPSRVAACPSHGRIAYRVGSCCLPVTMRSERFRSGFSRKSTMKRRLARKEPSQPRSRNGYLLTHGLRLSFIP